MGTPTLPRPAARTPGWAAEPLDDRLPTEATRCRDGVENPSFLRSVAFPVRGSVFVDDILAWYRQISEIMLFYLSMDDQAKDTPKPEAVSAGGVIVRVNANTIEVLLLRDKRYDAWTLPKGHVEQGEVLEQAALREINEEAGVTEASVLFELGSFRRYVEKTQEWKTIHYFLMNTSSDQPLGKYENEYMETQWFPVLQLPKMYLPEQEKVITENRDKIIASIKEAPI